MSQNLQNVVKFQKFQLEKLVDFEKCCKTHIFLQKSAPIQPKTSEILPKFCQQLTTTLRVHYPTPLAPRSSAPRWRGGARGGTSTAAPSGAGVGGASRDSTDATF